MLKRIKGRRALSLAVAVCVLLNMLQVIMPEFISGRVRAADPDIESDDMPVIELGVGGLQFAVNEITELATDRDPGSGRIILDRDITENIVIPDDTEAVIDLNGHSIFPDDEDPATSHFTVYGKLKLKDSSGGGELRSDGQRNVRAIDVVNGGRVILENITVSDYYSSHNGGGIMVEDRGKLELAGATVSGCRSDLQGGGMYAYQGDSVTITGGEVSGNSAKNGGGIYYYRTCDNEMSADLTFGSLSLTGNTAEEKGGGLYVEYPLYSLTLTDSHVDNNSAAMGGGAYFKNTVDLKMKEGSTLSGNSATGGHGGGVFFNLTTNYTGSQITVENGTVSGNTSTGSGAGLFFNTAVVKTRNKITLKNTTLSENVSGNRGGAIYAYAKTDLVLNNTNLTQNSADSYGGAIYMEGGQSGDNRSTFVMDNSRITDNTLTGSHNTRYGAGLYIGSSTISNLNSGTISRNTKAVSGGGAYFSNAGTVNICEGMIFSENSLTHYTNGWKYGVSIYLDRCTTNMTGGIFTGNTCKELNLGGGGFSVYGGNFYGTGGTVKENFANDYGGGIWFDSGYVELGGTFTVSDNRTKGQGGGIYFNNCTVDLCGESVIENNYSGGYGGGAHFNHSNVELREDAAIRNNEGGYGGGAFIYSDARNFHMMGGSVSGNTARSAGGGFYFQNRRNLNNRIQLTGGEIVGNISKGTSNAGGGVVIDRIGGEQSLAPDDTYHRPAYAGATVEISTAITISGNTAANVGGGVYVGNTCRLELSEGAKIVNNTAKSGGGIYVQSGGYYYRNYQNLKDNTDGATEALVIYGGELHDNSARMGGRDLYVAESPDLRYYVPPYISVVKANQMDNGISGSCWYDENNDGRLETPLSNKTKVDNGETPKYSRYTFDNLENIAARVGETMFTSLQAAVDYIQNGSTEETEAFLLRNQCESIVIPEDLTLTIDLNGFSLYGVRDSVITVRSGAELTLKDSVGGSAVAEGKGTSRSNTTFGGGIYTEGKVIVQNVTLRDNYAQWGSALAVIPGGEAVLSGCTVTRNTYGNNNSTIRVETGTLTLENTEITNNEGRGIYVTGTSTINATGSKFTKQYNYYGIAIHAEGITNIYLTDCELTDNKTTTDYGTIFTNDWRVNVYLKDCLIARNTTARGAGLCSWNGGRFHLDNTVITGNLSNGDGGGVFIQNGNGHLYMKSSKIYENQAKGFGNDMRLADGSYYHNESGSEADHRVVEQFGLEGYDCWLDDYSCVYYVEDKEAHDQTKTEYQNVEGDLARSSDQRVMGTKYLTASKAPEGIDPVAEFTDGSGRQFITLSSAFTAAARTEGEVGIRLLRDVTEKVVLYSKNELVTLDFNGHTVTATDDAAQVFYINGASLHMKDSVGGGQILPHSDTSSKQTRAIRIESGKLIYDDIKICGFTYNGNGAAIYSNGGGTVNGTYHSSEIHIHSGTICHNSVTGAGGAIYFVTAANTHSVFEMTDGVIEDNTSTGDGAGIHLHCDVSNDYTDIKISGGTFRGNVSESGYGGGIYYVGHNSANDTDKIEVYGCLVQNNQAANYAGVCFARAGNVNYSMIFGNADKKTVLDGNYATSTYSAGYIHNIYAGTKPMIAQNIEVKNHRSGSNNSTLYFQSASLTVKDVDFHENVSEYGGDAILRVAGGELLIENCITHHNTARTTGAGLVVQTMERTDALPGTKIVRNCRSYNNRASAGAGLWDNSLGDVTYENVEVYNNLDVDGGAWVFANYDTPRTKTLLNCHVHDNESLTYGGAFSTSNFSEGTIIFGQGTVVENNLAANDGGAFFKSENNNVYNDHDTIIIENGAIFRNNTTKNRGGAFKVFYVNFEIREGALFTGNHAVSGAGAVHWVTYSPAYSFLMSGGVIENNTTDGYAGGVYAYGRSALDADRVQIDFSGGEIRNNRANRDGGVYVEGYTSTNHANFEPPTVHFNGTKITGNFASSYAGGVFVGPGSNDTYIQETALITNNTAGTYGGGVYVSGAKTNLTLNQHGRVYGNTAALGNDFYLEYNSSWKNGNTWLQKASDMFTDQDIYQGIGWLDETLGTTTTQNIKIRPLGRSYPYTLSYHIANKIVAVYNNTGYELIQDAVNDIIASGQPGEIIMVDDTVESFTVAAGANVRLNLNGHYIEGGGVSAITNRGVLEIDDVKEEVVLGDHTYPVSDSDGRITGNAAVNGGGISVISGRVTMKNGRITGCMAGANTDNRTYGGGAVSISGGEFIMMDGSITDNVARYGSAVLIRSPAGVFTMYGGTISGNKTSNTVDSKTTGAGAIYNGSGEVNIYGGVISDNTAYQGGAVYNNAGNLNIIGSNTENGPVIENNIGGYSGGALYLNTGTVKIKNTRITGNRTTYAMNATVNTAAALLQGAGGGIFTDSANVVIDDGTVITGNSAVRGGAVYQYRGTVQISGENTVITANTAELGGGCAQNPLPGNRTTVMTLMDSASVYGNRSVTTAAGNDFYSAWEGTNTYQAQLGGNAEYTPAITLIAASQMTVGDRYNAWKNDNYQGNRRVGKDLVSGQYVIADVNIGNDIQITASYFDADAHTNIDSDFRITHLMIEKMTDGANTMDDGRTVGGVTLDNALPKEKHASDLLDDPSSGAVISDQTYVFNEETFHYIEYQGKLYEQNQAVEWMPGNDSGASNYIVRSFDSVTYQLEYTFEGDPKEREYNKDFYNTEIKVRAEVACGKNQAVLTGPGMTGVSVTPMINEHGEAVQVMTGYIKKRITVQDMTGSMKENIVLQVMGVENGRVLKPKIEMWFNGNNTAAHGYAEAQSVTVSAAPKYNVVVMNNASLVHFGYFDTINKVEVAESDEGKEGVVKGTVMGFGVTLELYNDPTIKGLTGIELPANGVEFDLSFTGKLYNSYMQEIENGVDTPILWAYKENNNLLYGRDLESNLDIINMSWDDEDVKNKRSHYAYGAAPYNSGGDDQSCFDGGSWYMTKYRDGGSSEMRLHVKVDNYQINGGSLPNKWSGGVASSSLNSEAVKAFSAGYIQLVLPLDPHDEEHGNAGYYQAYMDAVASNLSAVSVTGQIPDEVVSASSLNTPELVKKDLDGMNEYYHFSDPNELKTRGYAVNERRYYDNYINVSQALTVWPEGTQPGDKIAKSNMFNDQNGKNINGTGYNDNGRGDTPLNSTVFIQGSLYFQSGTYNTGDENSSRYGMNDPLYNATVWNLIEYNYMTGYDILQKFDADAYKIVGAEPIVNMQNGNNLNNKLNGKFKITNSEGDIAWSNVTKEYKLTILYGAKPDGSNWTKEQKTDTSVDPIITYDDGGAADMDLYREENLMFFVSLDDLHESLGDEAKCVAVLYQFRDTVIRTENTVVCAAKAEVTGDFEMVGDTYCTTNDVRAWTTYRPYYKLYYYDNLHRQNTVSFLWTDMQYNSDKQTTDKTRDDYEPPIYGAVLPAGVFMDPADPEEEPTPEAAAAYDAYTQQGRFPISLSSYTNQYVKTRYRNGVKVGGTHNGSEKGNSLLLYSVDTEITINVATKIKGTDTVKMDYTVSEGERDVKFRVTPKINIASGANKTALVRNGTQSTNITVDIKLPPQLHYQNGSVFIDYTYSQYQENEMTWTVEQEETPEGTVIHLTTFVSDIDKKLPEIFFDCFIGDAQHPANDIQETGTALTAVAEIHAEYAELSLMAAEMHSHSKSINILLTASEGISKSVGERLLELGEPIVFDLSYSNTLEGPTYRIQTLDVLPHNGDGRTTAFNGAYRVDSVVLSFTSADDFNGFLASPLLGFTSGRYKWESKYENVNNTGPLKELINTVSAETLLTPEGADVIVDNENLTITYRYGHSDISVPAFDKSDTAVMSAPAFFAEIPYVSGGNRFNIRINALPTEKDDPGTLLSSGSAEREDRTQMGGDQYHNCYAYRRATSEGGSIPLVSNRVGVSTVNRTISGVVWMDQDKDGMYNTREAVTANNSQAGADKIALEYPISDISVSLMKVEGDSSGTETLTPAINVLGQPVQPVKTDINGAYTFENVAPGYYRVVFTDDDDSYVFRSALADDKSHPISFERLSVTTDENAQADRGNKSAAVYSSGSRLSGCKLISKIAMPEKDVIPTVRYNSTHWNLGLYYDDLMVNKKWENMIYGINENTTIEISIDGREQETGAPVYNGLLRISNSSGEVEAVYIENGDENTAVTKQLSITENPAAHVYEWNLAQNDRIFLQAKNENGPIEYSASEVTLKANGADISRYYNVFETDTEDPMTRRVVHSVRNNQILGSVTITKYSNSQEPLQGAEFSIYQVSQPKDPDDHSYYGSKNGVGTTLTESYQTKETIMYSKVILGEAPHLALLKDLGIYNKKTNEITVTSGNNTVMYKVHHENTDSGDRYYYYTADNVTFSYEMIIGGAEEYNEMKDQGLIDVNDKYHHADGFEYTVLRRRVNNEREYYVVITVDPAKFGKVALLEFLYLPLYDTQGQAIYYTVRETKEPRGYVSLADFNMLTGMNLFDGMTNGDGDYVHDLCFEVQNTKQMELPETGGSSLSMTVTLGALLMTLGGACLFGIILKKKKKKEGRPL